MILANFLEKIITVIKLLNYFREKSNQEDEYNERNHRHVSAQANSYTIQSLNDQATQCTGNIKKSITYYREFIFFQLDSQKQTFFHLIK